MIEAEELKEAQAGAEVEAKVEVEVEVLTFQTETVQGEKVGVEEGKLEVGVEGGEVLIHTAFKTKIHQLCVTRYGSE